MYCCVLHVVVFFFKQKTADEMRISDWSSDVCSSDLEGRQQRAREQQQGVERPDVGEAERQPVGAGEQRALDRRHEDAGGDEEEDDGEHREGDRKSVVEGRSVSVRVDPGGRRIIKEKKNTVDTAEDASTRKGIR